MLRPIRRTPAAFVRFLSVTLPLLSKSFSVKVLLLLILLIPAKSILKAQNILVGLTSNGGPQGMGTAFSIKTDGTTFTHLNDFADWGKNPNGNVVLGNDGLYYGMTSGGGTFLKGTIFRIDATGGITILHQFNSATEGGVPYGSLTLYTDGNFYGVTSTGGTNSYGTIFKMTPAGVFTVIRQLVRTDGTNPRGHLVIGADGNFYGLAYSGGGPIGYGSIFKVTPAGILTVLHTFIPAEGVNPYGSLMRGKDGNFYGTTAGGGAYINGGTIFKITPTGVFTVLKSMRFGIDGSVSNSTLVQRPDSTIYGLNSGGGGIISGSPSNGTLFRFKKDSTDFVVLHKFISGPDGAAPFGSLTIGTDGLLYGMTTFAGAKRGGTIFKMTAAGVFSVLFSLKDSTDGTGGRSALLQGPDGNFYGMTPNMGPNLYGTLFRISSTGTFKVLTSFNGAVLGNSPQESLSQATDNAFYGTALSNGAKNYGTAFRICGGSTTLFHTFNRNVEGGEPKGNLLQARDGNFYGLTSDGGTSGVGTAFKITPAGVYTVIHHFNYNVDGGYPFGSLIQGPNDSLYGMTSGGGPPGQGPGTIFKMTYGGSLRVIHGFIRTTEGSGPEGDLVKGTDTFFFGMTKSNACIFRISINGRFDTLEKFNSAVTGDIPVGSLVLGRDSMLYGMTTSGGISFSGSIFMIDQRGLALTVLKLFSTATDGSSPRGNLVQAADGKFYGMTSAGGTNKVGTIFSITKTKVFTVLRHFDLLNDGGTPLGSLIIQKPLIALTATPRLDTTREDVPKAITLAGTGGTPMTFNVVIPPKNGIITGGLAAARTYTPNPNYNGKDSFYFVSIVGCQASPAAKRLITITQVNDTPVLKPIGNRTIKVNTPYTFTASATDADAGQTKTFSLITPPTGATINPTTGVFNWTPPATGAFTFKVRVTDNGVPVLFKEEQITITVTVTGAAPVPLASLLDNTMESISRKTPVTFPNPVRDRCIVVLNQNYLKFAATVTDMRGSIITNWMITSKQSGKMEFDMSRLKAGVYFVQINSGVKTWVIKMVKL